MLGREMGDDRRGRRKSKRDHGFMLVIYISLGRELTGI
jgi:hypothetical protein